MTDNSHVPVPTLPRREWYGAGEPFDMSTESTAFPAPSSLKVVPGTEAAQAAYPYYMQFTAADDERFWFYNSMHFPEPMMNDARNPNTPVASRIN